MGTRLLNSSSEDMMTKPTLADYHSALKTQNHHSHGIVNTTTVMSIANHGKELWKSPYGTMTRIEALVLLTVAFLLFLAILGSWRRRSNKSFIQKGVFVTYTLSWSLVSYTFGSMQSSAVKSSMYPIWAVSLYFLLIASVDTTAYNLTDHNQSRKLVIRSSLDLVYALLISVSISSHVGFYLVYAMVFLVILRFAHRISAGHMSTLSYNMNKIVSDYMEEEHKQQAQYNHPCKMDGYRYLVDWPLQDIKLDESGISYNDAKALVNDTQVVTVEKVWKKLNNTNVKFHMELRDTCLSFSLFHLLRRRFFGYACSESSQKKTRDFVFEGLLLDHKGKAIDHSRVFKVIEVELAFMYDFFFTKYAYLYYGSRAAPYWSLVTASLMFVTAYLTATSEQRIRFSAGLDASFIYSKPTATIDMVITMLILTCIAVLEVLQQLFFWTSIWGRVSLVCQYVRKEASSTGCGWWCSVKLKEVLARIGLHPWNQHYWRDRLDQYSLVESVVQNRRPVVCNCTALKVKVGNCYRKVLVAFWSSVTLVVGAAFYPAGHRRGLIDRKSKEVKLPAGVKEALVQCLLLRTEHVITNGTLALELNKAYDLLDFLGLPETPVSLKRENQTINILRWHIATWYCKMAKSSADLCSGAETDFVVATTLSKYCAYLVVSAPKLLPGHHFDTTLVFDKFAAEACNILGGANDEQEKFNCMERLHEGEGKGKYFYTGVQLGKRLQAMEDAAARWKVLSDFWSEMLLYLAPSDNVKEHIECLAKGGEFITHLWALLTHAGILDRGQSQTDIENASTSADKWATTQGNYVHSEMKVQKGENNLVQNMERTPNAGTAPSVVIEQ